MEYQGPQLYDSDGRKPRDGDLATFWNSGQGFPTCTPWKGQENNYLTKVLSQKQWDLSALLDPQRLPQFNSQRCSRNEEWQLCSSEEAANDKRKWMDWGGEPQNKGRHCCSCNTQSRMPLTGCGHLWGTTDIWFKAWWRKGPKRRAGLFVILTSRRKRGSWTIKAWCCRQLSSRLNC